MSTLTAAARASAIAAGVALMIATTGWSSPARADDTARAKEAYARGQRAHDAGDYKGAAAAFAEADGFAPSPVALLAALDAAVLADDPVLGAELLERSQRAPPTPALQTSIDDARKKLGQRAGKIRVVCPAAPCSASIDGRAAKADLPQWTTTGRHSVVVVVGGERQENIVNVVPNDTVTVTATARTAPAPGPGPTATTPTPPPPETPPAAAPVATTTSSQGLPRTVFFGGVVLTAALGAGVLVGGMLAKEKYDQFNDLGCPDAPAFGCEALQSDGQPLVTITNVLIVGAAVAALATAVIGLGFTDWKSSSPRRASLAFW